MSVEVCLANSGYNNSQLSNKDLIAMPVVSQRRSSTTSTSGSSTLTGSYRSTSSLDRPYYSSSTGSYVNSRSSSYLSRNLDNKRTYSRHTSISEDSGVGSRSYSRTDRFESREPSVRRESQTRDSGLSLTGRRISSITLAESVDDLRQKYSPSNYIPNIRKPESKLDFSRAKSITSDIGKPPVETKALNESRLNLSHKNKVIVSNDKMPINSLSVTTNVNNYNRKHSNESNDKNNKTDDNTKPNSVDTDSNSTLWKEQQIDDNNGNVTQSVSEIRKIFDSPAVGKLTSVIPPFLKNGTNSGKYEIAQVNKTNEINVTCPNLKLSNKSNNSQSNGNNVRWAFLSNNSDVCELTNVEKRSTPVLNKDNIDIQLPSTSKNTFSNHTSNFASYIPVNVYETETVGDILTNFDQIDSVSEQDNCVPILDAPGDNDATNLDMSRDTHDFTRRAAANRSEARYMPPHSMSTNTDLSTSPRLNRSTIASTNGSASISTINRSSLERHREEKTSPYNSKSDKNIGLNGLKNIGNTCFMNSVVQCLSNTRFLLEYLRDSTYLNDINSTTSSMKGALVKAFANVIQELWSDDSDKIVNPSSLKYQIQHFAPRFMGYAQQDAQEFLRYLLEGLHEDVNRVKAKPPPILTEIDDKLSDAQKSMEAWSRYLRIDDSTVVDIFVGQLKSTLKCSVCGYCSVTFDPFWDLSLPIGSGSITQCLENFTREEVMDGHEKPTCSKCQTRRKCTKSFSIQKFPKILVLHLKRFSPNERFRGKLTTLIDFPLQSLDLSAFAANRGTSSVYNLYAVSNHSGTTYSGHYTAYCKHPYSGEWHEYNDSRVSSISSRNVVSSEAYVLFYELSGHSSHL